MAKRTSSAICRDAKDTNSDRPAPRAPSVGGIYREQSLPSLVQEDANGADLPSEEMGGREQKNPQTSTAWDDESSSTDQTSPHPRPAVKIGSTVVLLGPDVPTQNATGSRVGSSHRDSVVTGVEAARLAREASRKAGCRIPTHALFVAAGLLSVLSALLSGVFIYQFAEQSVNNAVLSDGRSQAEAATAHLVPQVEQMERFIDETAVVLKNHFSVGATTYPTIAAATLPLNRSIFWNYVARLQLPSYLAGMQVDVLFPPTNNISEVDSLLQSSVFFEPLRDGNRSYTYQRTLADGVSYEDYVLEYDESGVARVTETAYSDVIDVVSYYSTETQLTNKVYSHAKATASVQDGTPYWYLQLYQYVHVDGKFVCVTAYKLMSQFSDIIIKSLSSGGGSTSTSGDRPEVFLYDTYYQTIVATSFEPEVERLTNCYKNYDDYVTDWYIDPRLPCMSRPTYNSTFPEIRELFNQVVQPSWFELDLDVPTTAGVYTINGAKSFVVTRLMANHGEMRLFLVWTKDAGAVFAEVRSKVTTVIAVCCAFIVFAALVNVVISVVALLRPMEQLSHDMETLATFDTTAVSARTPTQTSIFREVHALQTQFAAMTAAIHSFSLYVPKDVVKEMLMSGAGVAALGMSSTRLTVMFIDIADFTTLCESLESKRNLLSSLLADYFRCSTEVLMRHGATIDKFIGDAIMCFWGAPLDVEEPELRALCSALDVVAVCPQVSGRFADHDVDIKVRIGATSGPCLVGNIGSEERMNYTALGDTVNTASRLEGLNKQFHSTFMVSETVLERCTQAEFVAARLLGSVVVKGKSEPLEVYEVFGFSNESITELEADVEGEGNSQHSLHTLSRRGSNSSTAIRSSVDGAGKLVRRGMVTPEEAFREAHRKGAVPAALAKTCLRYNRGMKAFLRQEFSEAQKHLESVVRTLEKHTLPNTKGFLVDAHTRLQQCTEAMAAGGAFDPTFVAKSK